MIHRSRRRGLEREEHSLAKQALEFCVGKTCQCINIQGKACLNVCRSSGFRCWGFGSFELVSAELWHWSCSSHRQQGQAGPCNTLQLLNWCAIFSSSISSLQDPFPCVAVRSRARTRRKRLEFHSSSHSPFLGKTCPSYITGASLVI